MCISSFLAKIIKKMTRLYKIMCIVLSKRFFKKNSIFLDRLRTCMIRASTYESIVASSFKNIMKTARGKITRAVLSYSPV